MHNLLLMKKNEELLSLSKELGFSKTLFLGSGFVLVSGDSKKQLLKSIKDGKKKGLMTIYLVKDEEMLRFALEKTSVDMVFGQELINAKDSVHFVRGGLDQITCKIAASQGKIVGFSFSDILGVSGGERSRLLARMMFNIKLCKKYKVRMFFGNFSLEKMSMRSGKDLEAFFRVLGGSGKEVSEI